MSDPVIPGISVWDAGPSVHYGAIDRVSLRAFGEVAALRRLADWLEQNNAMVLTPITFSHDTFGDWASCCVKVRKAAQS